MKKIPLVVGKCGVPYLLLDKKGEKGVKVLGELYSVKTSQLKGMDEYEGVGKTYYGRVSIDVNKVGNGTSLTAWVYGVLNSEHYDLNLQIAVEEYTLETHDKHYQAIQHILV